MFTHYFPYGLFSGLSLWFIRRSAFAAVHSPKGYDYGGMVLNLATGLGGCILCIAFRCAEGHKGAQAHTLRCCRG